MNITDYNKVVETLRESEEKYRILAEHSMDGIFLAIGYKLVYANHAFLHIVGYPSMTEMSNINLMDRISPAHRQRLQEDIWKALEGEFTQARYDELEGVRVDGEKFFVDLSLSKVVYQGKPHALGVVKDITKRKQSEDHERKAAELNRIHAEINDVFLNQASVETAANHMLRKLGEFMDVCRAYIFHYSEDGKCVSNVYEWCAEAVSPQIDSLQQLPAETFSYWQKELVHNRIVGTVDIKTLPKNEREILKQQNIKSIIITPLFVNNGLFGFIGFDETRYHREWRPEEILALRAVAHTYASAVERKQEELALRKTKEKLQQIINNAQDGIFHLGLEGEITFGNVALEGMTGYSVNKLTQMNIWEMVAPECQQAILERLKATVAGEPVKRPFDFEIVHKDGHRVALESTTTPVYDKGELVAIEGVARDITERKKAEEALQQEKAYTESIVKGVPNMLLTINLKGEINYANDALAQFAGVVLKDVVGKPLKRVIEEFNLLLPASAALIMERGKNRLQSGEPVTNVELEMVNCKGEMVPCVYSASRIKDSKGEVIGEVVLIKDITEQKKAEEQRKYSFIRLADTVSRALESRDPFTAGHQQGVASLSRQVGEKLGLDEDKLQGLYISGLLHDVGKISIPASILNKVGKLTDEEWALIRAHTKRGYEIVKDAELPWPVAEIALHHHERLDGSGYPHGINSNKLSLENRILAVCDVVEAMSSHRPYRPARSKEEILEEIRGGKGTKYDATVVDIMVQMIEDGEFDFAWNDNSTS